MHPQDFRLALYQSVGGRVLPEIQFDNQPEEFKSKELANKVDKANDEALVDSFLFEEVRMHGPELPPVMLDPQTKPEEAFNEMYLFESDEGSDCEKQPQALEPNAVVIKNPKTGKPELEKDDKDDKESKKKKKGVCFEDGSKPTFSKFLD